jgi:hypothetical protein
MTPNNARRSAAALDGGVPNGCVESGTGLLVPEQSAALLVCDDPSVSVRESHNSHGRLGGGKVQLMSISN